VPTGRSRRSLSIADTGRSSGLRRRIGPSMCNRGCPGAIDGCDLTWSGAHRDGSPLAEDSCCRIRCDRDRRLLPLPPIPTSRGFSALNPRRQPWPQLRRRPTVMTGEMQPPRSTPCISASRRRRPGTPIRRTSGAVAGRPRAVGDSPVPFVTPFLVQRRVLVDHFFTRSPPVSPGIGPAGTEPRVRACRAERRLRADTDGWSRPGSCLPRWPGPP
jgi:hypothetical protein